MNTRLFIKVDQAWLSRFDAYCATTGMTRSGAVRSALEPLMTSVEKGKLPAVQKWGNMNTATKIEAIRANDHDIDRVAETHGATRRAVYRFAYNHLGPMAGVSP